jgi:hypothetical protein
MTLLYASPAGLTRGSILFAKRGIAGSILVNPGNDPDFFMTQ